MDVLDTGTATLHHRAEGDGSPVLLIAPGGLHASRAASWDRAPWDPVAALAPRHRTVVMDQRNTGTSWAPVTADTGWGDYADDQLAVLDHLGIDRFHVVGMCIGGAFILELIERAPERVAAAALMQPIGRDGNDGVFAGLFDAWRAEIGGDHPEADDAAWEGCRRNLFGDGHTLWSVPDDSLTSIPTPMVVLMGADEFHPSSASRLLAERAPHATLIERWKEPDAQGAARAAIDDLFAAHPV